MTVDEIIKHMAANETEDGGWVDRDVAHVIIAALRAGELMRRSYAYCEVIKKERWLVGEWSDAIKAWDRATSDDESKCEKCRHDEFDLIRADSEPDPGYRCRKCGYVHWI